MEEKDDDHEADDDGLFEKIVLQCFDGFVDQFLAVVSGDNFDAGRE